MTKQSGQFRVGVGGWFYEPWRQTFYPAGTPKAGELAYASRQLATIEINATYYRTQSAQSFRRWAGETPDNFVFAVKANRFATNRKDLADGSESIMRFVGSGLSELGVKLGPLLWQLAPTKTFDPKEIEGFFANLPSSQDGIRLRHVVEVRHPSFVGAAFVALARRYNVAICLAASDDYPLIADPTADFCYLRLQTTKADIETGYDSATIASWSDRISTFGKGRMPDDLPMLADPPAVQIRDCFVYVISGAKERNPAAARALQASFT